MNFKIRIVSITATALLSAVVYAQTPATNSMSQNQATDAATTNQVPLTKKAERAANRAFAKRIQQTIYKTKGLDGADIVVFAKANTGRVTLAGSIQSEDQNRIATDVAAKVQGVTSVTSKLTLQEEGS
ncbi:hyperosmotically inducible protein [Paraburkholderia sp. EB58]|jgi:hyperosmotically inducible protein|uniref:BON domain-containing protein n=1 Tax=Paraburkholderia sp. EB58 TaxID=3035125 RepID=UPI003D1BFB0F